MPRPERSVPAGAGSLSDLARHLRALREVAGQPTYRELGRRAHFSASTLARAASGQQLPSLAVAIAYAAACGQDIERTRYLWERAAQFAAARKAAQSAPPRTNLPPALQGLTARELETKALEDWLREDPEPGCARIAAIVGPAGIGKTTLAVWFAHQIRSLFPDGAFYADLARLRPGRVARRPW